MKFHQFRVHEDHRRRGFYDIFPGFEGDVCITKHIPGVIPDELHMHKRQTDYFTVADGKVLFRLVSEDGKEEKFIMTADDKKTVIIPPGIWHGYLALEPSIMVFYISHKYDSNDEFRRKCSPDEWTI